MHTAICTFDDRATAEQAVKRLVEAGFDRHDVHIQHRQADGTLMTEESENRWDGMEREVAVGHRVAETLGFFASLFGQDAVGHTAPYYRAVERGQCVVLVDASSDVEAQRAQNILLGMEAGDFKLVPRAGQPLRDLVGDGRSPGIEERFGTARADMGESRNREVEREREIVREREGAMASQGWGEQRTLNLVDDDQPIASPRLQSNRDEKPR